MTIGDLSSDEREYWVGQVNELTEQRDVAKLLKYEIRSRDQIIQNLEYSLERCSEESITRAKAEASLESWKAAALKDLADLRAEKDYLCNINNEIQLHSDKALADLRAENLSLHKTKDGLQLELDALSERCKIFERRVRGYELHESSPFDSPPAERLVIATPPADTYDVVVTPVNQRTMKEELGDMAMFDDYDSEGATSYEDDVLKVPDNFSDHAASPRGLYLQDDLQREEGFSYVNIAPTSSHELNGKDTTPFSEIDKVRAIDMAGGPCYYRGSNIEDLPSENICYTAALISAKTGTVHSLGITGQSAGELFLTSKKKDTCAVDLRSSIGPYGLRSQEDSVEPREFRTVCGYCMNE